MDITAPFDVDGIVTLMEECKAHLLDIGVPLARSGGYLKGRAKHRCDEGGPGWEPLSPDTVKRKLTVEQFSFFAKFGKRQRSMVDTILGEERKLVRALGIAEKKTGKARENALARAQMSGESLGKIAGDHLGMRADFNRRLSVGDVDSLIDIAMAETDRRKRHGAALRTARQMPLAAGERRVTVTKTIKGKRRTFSIIANPSKERQSMRRQGATRYRRDVRSTQVLGALRDAFKLAVFKAAVAVFWGPKWALAHHDGATVGNGAHVPQRRALIIEANDKSVVVGIFRSYMLEPFRGRA